MKVKTEISTQSMTEKQYMILRLRLALATKSFDVVESVKFKPFKKEYPAVSG